MLIKHGSENCLRRKNGPQLALKNAIVLLETSQNLIPKMEREHLDLVAKQGACILGPSPCDPLLRHGPVPWACPMGCPMGPNQGSLADGLFFKAGELTKTYTTNAILADEEKRRVLWIQQCHLFRKKEDLILFFSYHSHSKKSSQSKYCHETRGQASSSLV